MDDRTTVQPPLRPADDTDEALVGRICARDAAALAQLYDRYAAAVHALASHTLGPADAEEVVQEVFLGLWHKAGQYDPSRGAFGAWFMALARHRVVDELRRRGHRQRLQAAESVDRIVAAGGGAAAGVEDEVWQRERGTAVLGALQRLPVEQRRVLVLSYFGGLSHAAMAAHLGWPLGTVKKRVRLGLQKLRTALGGYAPQEDTAAASGTRPVPLAAIPAAERAEG